MRRRSSPPSPLPLAPRTDPDLRWRLALGAVALLGALAGVLTMTPYPVGSVVDDAMYLILAKSLATGEGYRSLNLPGAPPNTHFPPGYPAVLAAIWRLAPSFPANLLAFRAFNVLCLAAGAVAAARLLTLRGAGRGWGIALGATAAVSVPLLVLGTVLLSEPLFLALLLLLLPLLERLADATSVDPSAGERSDGHSAPGGRSAVQALGCGILIGAITLVRSHGIVLVPAVLLVLAARRRWRDAALVAGGALLCILPWQLWCARYGGSLPAPLLGGYDSYTSWWLRGVRDMGWEMVPRTLARTVPETTYMFAALFSPLQGKVAHLVTLLSLAGLAALAVAGQWRRMPVTLLFLAGYLGIVAIWPFQPGRFVWGVWTLLLALLLLGARQGARLGSSWRSPARAAALLAFCWVAVGYLRYEARAIGGRWWASIPRAAASHIGFAVGWTRANTPPDAIVATVDEGAVYLYTGRRTVPVRSFTVGQYLGGESTETLASEGLEQILERYPVHTVIVYTGTGHDVARLLSSGPRPRLAPLGQHPGGSAYLVLPR